jgi:hypothetical protein
MIYLGLTEKIRNATDARRLGEVVFNTSSRGQRNRSYIYLAMLLRGLAKEKTVVFNNP